MADIKGMAGLFGMTVTEFEQFTGYSRQELHRVMNNGSAIGTPRMSDVIRRLDAASYDMYSDTVARAEAERRKREEMLKSLSKICGLCYLSGPCLYIRHSGHPGWEGSKCRGFSSPTGEEAAELCKVCEKWYLYKNDEAQI